MQPPKTKTESQLVRAIEICKKLTGRQNPSDDLICAVFHSLTMEDWENSEPDMERLQRSVVTH